MPIRDEYIAKTRWIIACTLCGGIILILLGELLLTNNDASLIAKAIIHLGMALIISSILGLYLEITEIKDFFEKRLIGLFTRDEFIDLMSDEKLVDLSVITVKGLGHRRTDNPLYDFNDFARTVGYDLLTNVGKTYRKDYYESIDYAVLTPNELQHREIDPSNLDGDIVRVATTTRYKLIAPKENVTQDYEIHSYCYADQIPGLEPLKHFKFELKIDGKVISVDITNYIKIVDKEVNFDFEKKITFQSTALVELKLTSLEYDLSGHFTNYMHDLTKNATVHFSSREELDLEAEIFGMTSNYTTPSITSNSVSIHYPNWVLPGHGFFITWKRKLPC